jgi:DtxR family transcriptional regulator, Mn-dependent transcriptional regulator
MLSQTEENYLKVLFKLVLNKSEAGTNELALELGVKPASIHDMLKKLKEKNLVSYEKYGKITLTERGNQYAVQIVRNHRLWETFLFDKLEFSWDEVHDAAEQLEHVNSSKLIDRLDKFLGYPKFDPHGDPIPNANGVIEVEKRFFLSEIEVGKTCQMVGVKDNANSFLQYVARLGLGISSKITILSIEPFDSSLLIEVNETKHSVSKEFTDNIFVVKK